MIVESRIGGPERASDDRAEQIAQLPIKEKDHFLRRAIREEPLSVKLRKHLNSLSAQSDTAPMDSPCRTISRIFQKVEKSKRQRLKAERRKREEKSRRKLAALEAEEKLLWQNVSQHISEKKPGAYDSAVLILENLLVLVKYRRTQSEYEQRV